MREKVSKRTEHGGSFHTVKPSEASAGDYWSVCRCEHCVINIWDSLHGGTLMMLLA